VGPERFAIIPVDCGKPEARTRVADFYGNVLLAPFTIQITRPGLEMAACLIRNTMQKYDIKDCVCAIETTGRYHLPIARFFKQQQWDTRDVHPYTSSLIRRSADLGNKTDDIDLAAIHRAAIDGLAMQPEVLDPESAQWRLLVRHRRDLVEKAATLKIQLKETIHAYLPGYTSNWKADHFWDSPVAVTVATTFDSPQALRDADDEMFFRAVRNANSVIQKRTIDRIRAWSHDAAPVDEAAHMHFRRAVSLWKDLQAKWAEIPLFELEMADFLCRSTCVRLLAFPGINVITASDYGAELGPITNYATSKSIAGRAGLYPSRFQTSNTDCPNGALVVRRNRQLRAALVRAARCLNCCNQYFFGISQQYLNRHPDNDGKVPIARAFSRLSYYLIAGDGRLVHAALQSREKVLQKLLEFYKQRDADVARMTSALTAAMRHLSTDVLHAERSSLSSQYEQVKTERRTRRVVRLSELLPQILLRLDERLGPEDQTASDNSTLEQDETHGS
jgi:transposase